MGNEARRGRMVLIVDPDADFAEEMGALLPGDRVVAARTLSEAADLAVGGRVHAALLGPTFGSEAGVRGAAEMLEADPSLRVVLAANVVTNRILLAAVQTGLVDVIGTPVTARKLAAAIERRPRRASEVVAPAVEDIDAVAAEATEAAQQAPAERTVAELAPHPAPTVESAGDVEKETEDLWAEWRVDRVDLDTAVGPDTRGQPEEPALVADGRFQPAGAPDPEASAADASAPWGAFGEQIAHLLERQEEILRLAAEDRELLRSPEMGAAAAIRHSMPVSLGSAGEVTDPGPAPLSDRAVAPDSSDGGLAPDVAPVLDEPASWSEDLQAAPTPKPERVASSGDEPFELVEPDDVEWEPSGGRLAAELGRWDADLDWEPDVGWEPGAVPGAELDPPPVGSLDIDWAALGMTIGADADHSAGLPATPQPGHDPAPPFVEQAPQADLQPFDPGFALRPPGTDGTLPAAPEPPAADDGFPAAEQDRRPRELTPAEPGPFERGRSLGDEITSPEKDGVAVRDEEVEPASPAAETFWAPDGDSPLGELEWGQEAASEPAARPAADDDTFADPFAPGAVASPLVETLSTGVPGAAAGGVAGETEEPSPFAPPRVSDAGPQTADAGPKTSGRLPPMPDTLPPMPTTPPPMPGSLPPMPEDEAPQAPSRPVPAVGAPKRASTPMRRGSGKVVAVMSGKGGSGKTITATNLATAMTMEMGPGRISIVDADLQFGDVALLLQLDPKRTIADLVGRIDDLGPESVVQAMLVHESGLDILAAPVLPATEAEIPSKAVIRIIELLTSVRDIVIVDTPPVFDDALIDILGYADRVVVVVDMDLPSVKNAKIALDTLRASGFPLDRIRLVVNRVDSKARLDLVELERSLGREVFGTIPSDRLIPQSVNEGIPAVALGRRSRVARSFRRMAEALIADLGAR